MVVRASESERQIFPFLDEGAVHKHVRAFEDFVNMFGMGAAVGFEKPLVGKACVYPDCFAGVNRFYVFDKRGERSLIFRFKRFSAQYGQSGYVSRRQRADYFLFGIGSKGLAVIKVPGLGLKTIFAAIAASGYKQGYPYARSVCDVRFFNVSVKNNPFS